MRALKRRTVALFLVSFAAACGDNNDPVVPQGASVALNAGNNQSVVVAAQVATPLAVLVQSATGSPLAGVPVSWTVQSGGGAVVADGPTGADGVATAHYTAGNTAGPKVINASINGAAGSPVAFSITVTSGAAKRLLKASGDAQQNGPNTALPAPIVAQVVDTFGNPVAGTTVNWAIPAGGGNLSAATSVSDALGHASIVYTTAGSPSSATITATVAGLVGSPLSFTATTTSGIVLVKELFFTNTAFVHDQFIRGGLAFVCAWDRGLEIYDVGGGTLGGSPANPKLVGSVITAANGVSGGAQVHNAWWYWAPGGAKKYVFVGQEGPASGGIGVGASGDIHVVDVSDMAHPTEVAFYHMSGLGAPRDSAGVHNFWVDETNQVLYAAYYNGGVVALDVSGTLTGNLAAREIARIRPGGAGNTYIWGVQLYNGSLYATDMISGFWQLKLTGNTFTAPGGGNNVPERFGSDQWVANGYAYSGTWGTRAGHRGNALKVWQLNGTGAPVLVDSIITVNAGTVSDVEVSADGRMLMFSVEGGGAVNGVYFYSLVADKAHPTFIAAYNVTNGIHTATFAEQGGRRYVYMAKDPGSPSMMILDVTAINP